MPNLNELFKNLPEPVNDICNRLTAAGYQAYIVGGCVRDTIIGTTPHDYDLTTNARPDDIIKVFADMPQFHSGLKHGTVSVVYDKEPFEITAFRADGLYTDHRHPDEVTFSDDIKDDLSRRDFTINAMAYNPQAGLIDPFGGQDDITHKCLIRCVGDPNQRFAEDSLRIMRAIRFACRYNSKIESKTAEALRNNIQYLPLVSVERFSSELDQILVTPHCDKYLDEYRNVLTAFIPELSVLFDYDQHNKHHCYDLWHHTLAAVIASPPTAVSRWAALLHDIGKPSCQSEDEEGEWHFIDHPAVSAKMAAEILTRLRYPTAFIEEVTRLIELHDRDLPNNKAIARTVAILGSYDTFKELLALKIADNFAQAKEYQEPSMYYTDIWAAANALQAQEAVLKITDLKVNGNDCIACGYTGKEIGQELKAVYDDVMDGKVNNDRAELLQRLSTDYHPNQISEL